MEHWGRGLGVGSWQTLDGCKNDFIANCLQMGGGHLILKCRHDSSVSKGISPCTRAVHTCCATDQGKCEFHGCIPFQCPQDGRPDSQPGSTTEDHFGLCCQSTSHAPSWCLVEVQLRSTNFPMASLGISQIGLLHLMKQKLHQRVLSSGGTSKAFCHADEGGWLHQSCLKDCQKYKLYAPRWNQEWTPAISASWPFLMQDLTV